MSLLSASRLGAAVPRSRRLSYLLVLAAAALGLAFPTKAAALLAAPLAMGLVLLGVAHGACDQLIVPATDANGPQRRLGSWRYWLRFLVAYLGLAAVVIGLWWSWPAGAVGLFFLLTVWHWGSADALAEYGSPAAGWLARSLLRGLLLFAVPAWWWPAQTAAIINGLLEFAGASGVSAATFGTAAAGLGGLVLAGQLGLWASYALRRCGGPLLTDVLEVALLTGLLVALPPRLSVAVYFVFWHSLQHVLRLTGWLGYAGQRPGGLPALAAQLGFFLRRAAPLLLLSCLALLAGGWWLAPRLPDVATWFSFGLVVASIVTLPHALLVTYVMDARRWRRLRPGRLLS